MGATPCCCRIYHVHLYRTCSESNPPFPPVFQSNRQYSRLADSTSFLIWYLPGSAAPFNPELGPRLTLSLLKIEDGVCGGEVLYVWWSRICACQPHSLSNHMPVSVLVPVPELVLVTGD